jgi:4-amino-4-deoxy-L-arabinose transferase-like glycosyltransferase
MSASIALPSSVSPSRRRLLLVAALVLWIAALRWPFFLYEPLNFDEGLYLTVAQRMLHGARLYTDVWDNKPVGVFVIYSAIIELLGVSRFAVNLASALAVLASALLTFSIAVEIAGSRAAGVVAGFVLPAYMLDIGGDGANADQFIMVGQALSMLLLIRRCRAPFAPSGFTWAGFVGVGFIFGLLQGVLLQIKFLTIGETGVVGLTLALFVWQDTRSIAALVRLLVAFLVGYLICTAIVFAWFAATGGIGDMVFSNFVSSRLYVSSPFGLNAPLQSLVLIVRRLSFFAVSIVFALWFLWRLLRAWPHAASGIAPRAVLLVLAWAAGAFLDATSTGYFHYQYFLTLAVPLTLLGSLGALDAAGHATTRAGVAATGAILLLVAYPLAMYVKKTPVIALSPDSYLSEHVAAQAVKLVPPGSEVYFGDLDPILYALTGLVPATRYPVAYVHVFEQPEHFGVDPQAEIAAVFARRPMLVAASRRLLAQNTPAVGAMRAALRQAYHPVPTGDAWLDQRVQFYLRNEK